MQWKCRGGPETIFIEECVRYRDIVYRRGGSWSIFYGEYIIRVPVILLFRKNRKLNYHNLYKKIKKYM